MKQGPSPAPALARGILLLEQLTVEGQQSLEQLSASHTWPKSSVLRCLQTLEALGVVFQHPETRRWSALKKLCAIEPEIGGILNRMRKTLPGLANASGHCVELYLIKEQGLFLFDRAEPESGEITVQARIGYYRTSDELDATSQITYAFLEHHQAPANMWVWSQGERKTLTAEKRDRLIQTAHSSQVAMDYDFNEYGIRRFAVPVFSHEHLSGVLAIAQRQTPRAETEKATLFTLLSKLNPSSPS